MRPAATTLLGPFIDGFPNASGGIHFGSAMGFATSGINELARGRGFGFMGWAGYDVWFQPDFCVGLLLRSMVTHTYWGKYTQTEQRDLVGSMASLDLAISLLFN